MSEGTGDSGENIEETSRIRPLNSRTVLGKLRRRNTKHHSLRRLFVSYFHTHCPQSYQPPQATCAADGKSKNTWL